MKLVTAVLSAAALLSTPTLSGSTTTIDGQIFCDNFCKIYFNGLEVLDQTLSRNVAKISFNAPKTGTRTFAAILFDNPYDQNSGIWRFGAPPYRRNFTLDNLWCLGDGGFRAIFTDEECGEIVGTSADWKCEAVRTGPLDAEACFEGGFTTDPTYQSPVERGDPLNGGLRLYDPCIENDGTKELLDTCEETVISDYDQDWVSVGYDDSDWNDATTYTLEESLPKLGRSATVDLNADCTGTGWYCETDESTWGNTEFIWSDDLELDNVVLCRWEYTVTDCDSDSSSSSDSSSD